MIQNETAAEASVFTNGQLRIDYAAGCAYVCDEELHLTPIEYKLLCLLSRNIGKVLTDVYKRQMVHERIPDSVFDNAGQVELVDIDPQELIERLQAGKRCV